MRSIDFYREHLPEQLDARGDLAPPWEEFPHYERNTIGWRMGDGESWLDFFLAFQLELPTDFDTRLAYLQRHAKAPHNWSESAYYVLYPEAPDYKDYDDDDDGERERQRRSERRMQLIDKGLVASDVAYSTWRAKREAIRWPWEDAETPHESARNWTRELWFWSRYVAELRAQNNLPAFDAPPEWREIAEIIRTGKMPPVVPSEGLLSLVRCLAAGELIAPWQVGLSPADFEDSFNRDMGYVDAFRLWGMSVFDDQPMVDRYAETTGMPESWKEWMTEQFHVT